MADAFATVANAGTGPCQVRLYDGTIAATPATAIGSQVLLAELDCSDPIAAGGASSRVLTWDTITQDSSANAGGTASWARIVDGDGAVLFDTDVGNLSSSAGIKLSTTTIVVSQPVALTGFTLTVPATYTF